MNPIFLLRRILYIHIICILRSTFMWIFIFLILLCIRIQVLVLSDSNQNFLNADALEEEEIFFWNFHSQSILFLFSFFLAWFLIANYKYNQSSFINLISLVGKLVWLSGGENIRGRSEATLAQEIHFLFNLYSFSINIKFELFCNTKHINCFFYSNSPSNQQRPLLKFS